MLTEGSVRRRVSQAPLKDGFCFAGCGEAIRFRTNPQVCCPKCRIARKRRSARESMDKKRRSRGIPKVKGLLIRCVGCGIEVVLNRNAEARFCRSCYLENNRLAARKRSKERASTDAGRQYAREYERRKRRTDPSFRVSAHMRVLIHRGLNGQKQRRSWRTFVPYTLEELMDHLERQFLPGMTWENKGKWHIDHVVPLSSFAFEKPEDVEFQAAWALTNLRPLWGTDNIRKNARRTHLL